jgi:hypothetical protein
VSGNPVPTDPSYELDRPERPWRPPEHEEGRWFVVAAIALLLGAAGVITFLSLSTPSTPSAPPPNLTVYENRSAAPFPISTEFWGGNIGTSSPLQGLFTGDAAATPVSFYRWPGGQAGDGINYTSGVLTNATSGTPANVTTNLSTFVQWCESFGCHAILELPAEIDEPATAAYYVEYTEHVLGFRPSYWEIGNEPAIWTHYDLPWSQWNASQDVNATPSEYAQIVRLYDIAIHAVDPTAAIVGLGGVGTGAYQEATWIKATVAVNGPNLSAVSIHVYPAGTPPNGTATLSEFYSNLTGSRSLSARIPTDRAAIVDGCFTCTRLKLLVTEFGSASSPGSFSAFESGFPQVPFVAHEIVEGLDLNVTGMYLRQVLTPHEGSWLDTSTGTTHPLFELYSTVLPMLGTYVVPTIVAPADPSVAVVATEQGPNGTGAILLVNGDATTTATVHMAPPLIGGGNALAISWNSSTTSLAPVNQDLNDSPLWHLPPMSVLLLLPQRSTNPPLPLGPVAPTLRVNLTLFPAGTPVARPRDGAVSAEARRSPAQTFGASRRRSPGVGARSARR